MVPADIARLHLRLRWDGRRVRSVQLTRHGPGQACRLLEGQSPAEVLRQLPLLYSVCAQAQGVACASALEAAWGWLPPAPVLRARGWVVAAEAALELLWRWVAGGPAAPPQAPGPLVRDYAALRRTALHWRLVWQPPGFWCGQPCAPGLPPQALAWSEGLQDLLRTHVLGLPAEAFVALADQDDGPALSRWVADGATTPARLLADWGWGRPVATGLPLLGAAGLGADMLAARVDGLLQERPWSAAKLAPAEAGPLADEASTPALSGLLRRHGRGLALRLLAGLVALARWAVQLGSWAAGRSAAPRIDARRGPDGQALACLAGARGPLLHALRATPDRLQRLRILAPVDWLAHPRGALVRGLAGRHARSEDDLRRQAARVLMALDPCLPCELEVVHA